MQLDRPRKEGVVVPAGAADAVQEQIDLGDQRLEQRAGLGGNQGKE